MTQIKIEPVTRIESHGRLNLEFHDDGSINRAYFTTPVLRGFEAFLVGAPIERIPWLASRVCGVCPVSHAVSASQAIEKALNVDIPETAKVLREMLVLSQLIDSHALSFVVLSLPDLVPKDDAHSIVDIKSEYPDLFEKGMRLHTIGRSLTATMGGRNVHPVNVRLGGMGANPLMENSLDYSSLLSEAQGIVEIFLDQLKNWFEEKSDFISSIGSVPSNYMALSDNGKVSFTRGQVRLIDSGGQEIAMFDPNVYTDYIKEMTVPETFMKAPFLKSLGPEKGILRVNCLARANVNGSFGTEMADNELKELLNKWGNPLEHSLLSHWVRLIEAIYACERLQVLLDSPDAKRHDTSVPVTAKDGEAAGVLEAPRGTLFHHYAITNGFVTKANLLVATQNNQLAINDALKQSVVFGKEQGLDQDRLIRNCEMVLRAYDPCISCSTHITKVGGD